jgi:hypothetical protein
MLIGIIISTMKEFLDKNSIKRRSKKAVKPEETA